VASTTLTEREERVKEQRRNLPDSPGVYLFRDNRKRVIYVGKAKSIKKRVAGHFSKASSSRSDMVAQVASIEFVATQTEAEGGEKPVCVGESVGRALPE